MDLTRAQWRKSSRSDGTSAESNCVEVAFVGPVAGVRDSKNPSGPMLVVPADAWIALVRPADGR
jgi:hypothetical protein